MRMWSSGVVLGHRYELEERAGAGGFSEVWRARDLLLDRPVAVKEIVGMAMNKTLAQRHAGDFIKCQAGAGDYRFKESPSNP